MGETEKEIRDRYDHYEESIKYNVNLFISENVDLIDEIIQSLNGIDKNLHPELLMPLFFVAENRKLQFSQSLEDVACPAVEN